MLRLLAASILLASPALAEMTLELPGLEEDRFTADQAQMGAGCGGTNLSPEVPWSGAPPEAQSFILTAYDPDAPTGSGAMVGYFANTGSPARASVTVSHDR